MGSYILLDGPIFIKALAASLRPLMNDIYGDVESPVCN